MHQDLKMDSHDTYSSYEEGSRVKPQHDGSNGASSLSVPVIRQRSAPVSMQRARSSLSKTTSISKHYELNEHILNAFESLYLQNKYRVAYAIGMQFVETALFEIPKHGYFYSSRHEKERLQSSHDAMRVTRMLEEMLKNEETMLQEQIESEREERERERIAKLSRLAQEQHDHALSLQQYERERQALEKDVRYSIDHEEYVTSTASLCGSLLEYSEMLSAAICRPDRNQHDDLGVEPSQPFLRKTSSELELEQALFLSGLQVASSSPSTAALTVPPTSLPLKQADYEMDIEWMSRESFGKFTRLCNAQRIRISRIDTYQGRLVGSINGCTVIAPLLCIHHFYNHESGSSADTGLPDEAIRQVIDEETPVILPEVRELLGLTKDALIIPSDVHDYLIQRSLLTQEQFVTVMGGNILSTEHVDAFVNALVQEEDERFAGKRVAATLFFQEHVVAIHKLHRGERTVVENGEKIKKPIVWFDFVDSLPFEHTLSKNPFQSEETSNASFCDGSFRSEQREGPEEVSSRDPSMSSSRRMSLTSPALSFSSSFSAWDEQQYASDYVPYAARIRCVDEESLKAALQWFACSKLSPENKLYIDTYSWDDKKSDFDPRVFQGFIWREA